jgi:hypothetical protein
MRLLGPWNLLLYQHHTDDRIEVTVQPVALPHEQPLSGAVPAYEWRRTPMVIKRFVQSSGDRMDPTTKSGPVTRLLRRYRPSA